MADNRKYYYLNEVDNLVYCGKCHTPKQKRFDKPLIDGRYTVYLPCECRSKEIEEECRQAKRRTHYQTVKELRSQGIRDKKILKWTFANDNGTTPNLLKAQKYVENFEEMRKNNLELLLWGKVGTGKSFFALEQIYNVIDSRYIASKPLIITTNLSLSELQDRGIQTDYRRIYDRVLEMCVPIFFDGESKRKDKAEEKLNN